MSVRRPFVVAAVAALPLGVLLMTSSNAAETTGVAGSMSVSNPSLVKDSVLKASTKTSWRGAASREDRASRAASPHEFGTIAYNKWFARVYMADKYGWGADQFRALEQLWQRESGWNQHAQNTSSGAYGIPQALPGSKMGSFGADWTTNPETQIKWGLSYIKSVYGTPSGALASSLSRGWY